MINTLSYLIKNNIIDEYKIISGKNNFNDFITGIFHNNIPSEKWVDGGLFVLDLDNFSMKNQELRNLIEKLSKKSMNMIIYNSKHYIKAFNILNEFTEIGVEFNFPIVYVIPNVKISDFIYFLAAKVNENHFKNYRDMHKIYSTFSHLGLKSKGIDAIINYFKKIVGNPVAVYDVDYKCIATTDSPFNTFFEVNSTSTREDLNYLYYITQKINIEIENVQYKDVKEILFPITIGDKTEGYLCVFELKHTLRTNDYFILEIAATATLLEMKKRIERKTIEEKFINNLIYDLINNKIDRHGLIFERARLIGLNTDNTYIVIIFELINSLNYDLNNEKTSLEQKHDKIYTQLSKSIHNVNSYSVVGRLSNSIIALWPLHKRYTDNTLLTIKKACKSIQKDIVKKFMETSMIVGIGSPAENLKLIYKSYKEAKDAISLGVTIYGKDSIIEFKDLGVLRLLSKIEDKNSLIETIPEEIINLKHHDKIHNSQLFKTLEIYLQCNCNASKAAQKLFIHYKTILYRLEKINKICKIDLENYYDRLNIEIGIKILKLLENEESLNIE
ncbi:PucR family transcriptional regulator [Clostridium sp. JNZ X4-2]